MNLKRMLMRVAPIGILSTSNRAFAEVCDKVQPLWVASEGPATFSDELYWSATGPSFLALCLILAVSVFVSSRWLVLGAGALSGVAAMVHIVSVYAEWDIIKSASMEGCSTGFPTAAAPFLFLSSACLLIAMHMWRRATVEKSHP